MLSYCVNCERNTKSINPRVSKTRNGRIFLSKCAVCNSKNSRFIEKNKKQVDY